MEVNEKEGFWFTKTLILFHNQKFTYSWKSKKFPIQDFLGVRAVKAQTHSNSSPEFDRQTPEDVRYVIEIHSARDTRLTQLSVFGNFQEMQQKCRQMTRFVSMMKELQKVGENKKIRRQGRISVDYSNDNQVKIQIRPPLYLFSTMFIYYLVLFFVLWSVNWIIEITWGNKIAQICMIFLILGVFIVRQVFFQKRRRSLAEITIQGVEGGYPKYVVSYQLRYLGILNFKVNTNSGICCSSTRVVVENDRLYIYVKNKKKICLGYVTRNPLMRYLTVYYPLDNVADFEWLANLINQQIYALNDADSFDKDSQVRVESSNSCFL
eukprot:TRINITY_DN68664_c0_g2_i11.p2 TRINITY_DN68664_c0_g2~~TRINITY_DN68664_c0_g2_i11.p2  ORF type:complete len:322 (+),score=24.34 TRINITY_DN68664_c0_g2_i11:233-1198(+)